MSEEANHSVVPVILAGGSGTRLWPLSRSEYPKQLLQLTGDETLLQDTANRVRGLAEHGFDLQPPLVVCNEEHRFLVNGQLDEIGQVDASLLLEPMGRNTAPAVTLAAAWCRLNRVGDPLLLVLPSDQVILDPESFCSAVQRAAAGAAAGAIVTFGVVPDRPETGYGYIEYGDEIDVKDGLGLWELIHFVEKPDARTATVYLEQGNFLWNGGMFLMRASVWNSVVQELAPSIYEACEDAIANCQSDGRFVRPDATAFACSPSDSIDYAVMEKLGTSEAAFGAVVPLEAGWSDVGSWSALQALAKSDEHNNVVMGDAFVSNSTDNLVLSSSRLVAAVGISNSVIVETPDAVLVAERGSAQSVREVVDWLKSAQRPEAERHTTIYRPWGHFELLDHGPGFQVKRLSVSPGAALSLQLHHHRAEHWVVVKGTAKVTRGDEEFLLTENCSTYIPVAEKHRLANPGSVALVVIEVQSGSYLGEDDIVRFEDVYDRANP